MPIFDIPSTAAPATLPTQLPSVRVLLIWLVLACLLPMAIGAGILSQFRLQDGRAELQNNTMQTTRALVQALDGQLAKAELVAHALATSDALARHDFAAFHRRAVTLLQESNVGQRVLVYDIDGQQRVNTMRPFDFKQALPRQVNPEHVKRVFAGGRTSVAEVLPSPAGSAVISIAVPVYSGPNVVYVLCVEISPQQINRILSQQKLPPQWVVTILDNTATIAARTRSPEKYVGKKGVPAFLKLLREAPEGTPEITTLEGIATLGAYSRSATSGWTVFIGIPRHSLEAALMHSMALRGLGVALIFGLSIGLAWFVGGRITRSTRAIVASAAALGAGEAVHMPLVYLREADDIARAMANASRLLNERMRAIEASHAANLTHEADMAQAQRIAKIGGWRWDARTDMTQASPELCRIFGRTDFPPFAQQSGVLFPHAAWRELRHAIEEVVNCGKGYDLELPALRADGTHFWINTRSEVVRGAGGEVTGMRGMVQDITERKQAESIAKSERFIKAITNAVPGMVSYWDRQLRCHFANQSYLEWYGKLPEHIIGGTLQDLMGGPMFALNEAYVAAVLAGEKQQFERTVTKPDGSIGHALAHYMPDIDAYGEVIGFFALVSDVTQLKKAQGELRLAANVYQNTVDGIMVTDAQRMIVSVNPAFSAVTGYSAREAIGQTPRLLESHRQAQEFHASVWRQITQTGQWEGEIWNRRKDGEMFLAWQTTTRIAGSAGEAARYVSVFRDITATWSKNERIKHLAFHDALTDLPNRALLMERLERHIVLAARAPRTLAVMFLDLDQFKSVNDCLGHHVGDDVLIAVAHKLQALVRQSDTVARLGGDEFVILFDSPASRENVIYIAERIIASIGEPMQLRGETARIGTSIGMAMFPADGNCAAQLLKHADSAMYASKNAGKNTYRFFMPDAAAHAEGRQMGVVD